MLFHWLGDWMPACAMQSFMNGLKIMDGTQGRNWGLWGPAVGCTSGPCLKLFNLHVRYIYLLVLFTQCLQKFFTCPETE